MTEYTKSYITDFGSSILIHQFHQEIQAETNITTTFNGITKTGDVIKIIFGSALTSGEETTLSNLISTHVPDTSPTRDQHFRVYPEYRRIKTSAWKTVVTLEFPGTDTVGSINYIDLVSNIDRSGTYYVQVVCRTINTILADGTFSNTSIEKNTLTLQSAFPTDKNLIEISVKSTDKNKTINLQEFIFWYEGK